MSIVGTRPPLISETNLYEPHHKVSSQFIYVIFWRLELIEVSEDLQV